MIRRNEHGQDPAEAVGRVLTAKRAALLRAYRDRLLPDDLEECLSQATLELVARARREALAGDRHIANALEQKFVSRIIDRQRAIQAGGNRLAPREATHLWMSPSQDPDRLLDRAVSAADPSEELSRREELERIHEVAAELTDDQRLVLACQVSLGMESGEFCERFGWSAEKFRKVAQRARARLRGLMTEYELGERCARLEDDLVAFCAGTVSGHRALMVRRHLANCIGCAAFVRELRLASGRVAAVLPVPATGALGGGAGGGIVAKLAALWRGASGAASAPQAATIAKAAAAALTVAAVVVGGHALGGPGGSRTVAGAGGALRSPRAAVAEPVPPRRSSAVATKSRPGSTRARTRRTRRAPTIVAHGRPAAATTPPRTTAAATAAARPASVAPRRPGGGSAPRRQSASAPRAEFGVE